jgi:hypothetical protein
MSRLHTVLASGMLTLALCDAGPTGYLPRAGPTPLRFGPKAADLPAADLPPLLMHTPKPRDPDGVEGAPRGEPSLGEAFWMPGTDPASRSSETTAVASQDPGRDRPPVGLAYPPSGGWWEMLVTNKHGYLTVPGPQVDFVPPAVSTPRSRAVYQTTP